MRTSITHALPILTTAVLLSALLAPPAFAEWVKTEGPCGGMIESLAGTDTHLFAGIWEGGLYHSIDDGAHWTLAGDGLPFSNRFGSLLVVHSLAIRDTIVLAGTNAGLFRSSNWGDSWTEVEIGAYYDPPTVYSMVGTDSIVYTGTSEGVYRSTDYGSNWSAASTGLSDLVLAMVISGGSLYAGTNSSGVYRSVDSGGAWVQVNNGLPSWPHINALAVKGSVLFAGTDDGVFRSTNGGALWTAANDGLTESTVYSIAVSNEYVFVGMSGGVFRSINKGQSWTRVSSGLVNTTAGELIVEGTNLFAGTMGGVYRSSDSGDNWSWSSDGLAPVRVQALMAKGSTLLAGTPWDGAFRSIDHGNNWTPASNGIGSPEPDVQVLAQSGYTLFAGTFSGVFSSSEDSLFWTAANDGLTHLDIRALAVRDTFLLAGSNGGGVFRSTLRERSWMPANDGIDDLVINTLVVKGSAIFAGTYGGVYRSTNDGANWTAVNEGLPEYDVTALMATPDYLYAGLMADGVYRTDDYGESWTPFNEGLPDDYSSRSITAFATDGSNMYVGTGLGVYMAEGGNLPWAAVGHELADSPILTLAVCDGMLFAGAADGVWREDSPTSVGDGSFSTLPGSYTLAQNYPNPFNPGTIIEYSLPTRAVVTIEIFNVIGQKVRTLIDEPKSPGFYLVEWNGKDDMGSSLSTGVYFYRFKTGEVALTKKMLLLK
jgi:photosystem II stability/assembly factor-like uncharacterized protein